MKKIQIKTLFLLIVMFVIGGLGYCSFNHDGFGFRFHGFEFDKHVRDQWLEPISSYGSAQEFVNQCDFIYAKPPASIASKCFTRNPSIPNQVFLWGDSFAQMLTYGLIKKLPLNWQLLQVASRGCQASIFEDRESEIDYCRRSNYFALRAIEKNQPKVVIISQNGDLNKENAQLFSAKLHSLGVEKIIFVGKPPKWDNSLPKLVLRKMPKPTPIQSFFGLAKEKGELFLETLVSEKSLGINKPDAYLNLVKRLCTSEGCLIYVGHDIERGITALDDQHLTPAASEYVSDIDLVQLVTAESK